MVAKDQQGLIVMDVTVRYEQGRSLDDAYKEKADKYKKAAEQIAQKLEYDKDSNPDSSRKYGSNARQDEETPKTTRVLEV